MMYLGAKMMTYKMIDIAPTKNDKQNSFVLFSSIFYNLEI